MTGLAASHLLWIALAAVDPCEGGFTAVRDPVKLPFEAPQSLTVDTSDGSFWIVSGLSHTVLHYDERLRPLGSFRAPFVGMTAEAVTGIAYDPLRDTLLLVHPLLHEVWEVEKDGTPTGVTVSLHRIENPVNIIPEPYVKGIAFDPGGDGGRGSLWIVEAILSAVYELSLEGDLLRKFCHPDDPDGCPGLGRAAPASDIGLVLDGGRPVALELVGGRGERNRLLRVDLEGNHVGWELDLQSLGGRIAGFERATLPDAKTGEPRDVLLVLVESRGELHVLDVADPTILGVHELDCEVVGVSSRLHWTNHDVYDEIEVARDGESIATLPGTAASYTDPSPPEGHRRYEVRARAKGCESRLACWVTRGPGQVLASAPVGSRWAADLTEDADGNLWITGLPARILVFDKDLFFLNELPSPFGEEEHELAGIAYNPRDDSLFIYNASTNEVVEMGEDSMPLAEPFPSGIGADPDELVAVGAMLFDPEGAEGEGSFWYVEVYSGTLQERDRSGRLIRSCVHPDAAAEPPPAESDLFPYLWGLSASAEDGFATLVAPGGRIRDGRMTRILRLAADPCTPHGTTLPLEGIAALATPRFIATHESTHLDRPVMFVLLPRFPETLILEVDRAPSPVPRVSDLRCSQPTALQNVEITFENPGNLDSVEVLRDGQTVATIDGSAVSHVDADVPAGLREYSVRGRRGELAGDDVSCEVRVGVGSIVERRFVDPASFLHSLAPDPNANGYVAASFNAAISEELFLFDRDLQLSGTIPAPFQAPFQVAALAIRDSGGVSEIYCLGWKPGSVPGNQFVFPLRVVDVEGRRIRDREIALPGTSPPILLFPSGMAWDRSSDSFWLLERNASTIYRVGLDGSLIESFRHPAPPFQYGVRDFGVASSPDRGTLYLATAAPEDRVITKIVEVTRFGTLTGAEVPIGPPDYQDARGFCLDFDGLHFVVAARNGGYEDLVRCRGFPEIHPVEDASCVLDGSAVELSWTNADSYDAIAIERDGDLAATLPSATTSWRDEAPGRGPGLYRIVARQDALDTAGVVCGPVLQRTFTRGDVEQNGEINISDAIAILSYLFVGGDAPDCPKAADSDDSGTLDLTDAVVLLSHLFLSAPPPPPPYPYGGLDPTADDLLCRP